MSTEENRRVRPTPSQVSVRLPGESLFLAPILRLASQPRQYQRRQSRRQTGARSRPPPALPHRATARRQSRAHPRIPAPATPTRPQASGPANAGKRWRNSLSAPASAANPSQPQSTHFARHAAAAPQSPPSRPSTRQRSQPPVDCYHSETGCASVLAYAGPWSAGRSSPRSLSSFPSSSAMTARTPNPLFVSGPPSTLASRLALRTTDARRGCLAPRRFAVLLPLSQPRPRRLIAADEPGVPCPARLRPGRAASTPIVSSRRGSRRRRGRPCWGGARLSSDGDGERRADLIPSPHVRLSPPSRDAQSPLSPSDNDRRLTRRSPRFTDA